MSNPVGKYVDSLEGVFGKGSVTSGYRSQEEQNRLVAAGYTQATHSSHTDNNGYDLSLSAARSPDDVRQRAAARGMTVTKVIRETGVGKNQGTGPHWHVELGGPDVAATHNTSAPGQGVANPNDILSALQSHLAPEGMASGGVTTNAGNIMNADPELNRRADVVEADLNKQGQTIDVLNQVTDAAHAVQATAMQQQVQDSKAVSDEIVQGTQALKRAVTPVFQARTRIADQLDKINTMNPLERGIRGIFDLNYDRKHLESQLEHYDKTLQTRAYDYDYINKLHSAALGEIDRRYGLATAIPDLAAKQVGEDLGIVGMRIQQAAGSLSNLKDRVSTETQMIQSKALARADTLGRIDSPTVLSLANQAKKNNGVVDFNGVQFSYHELRDRLDRDNEQDLAMESHRMAIANGRMDLADKYATNLARSLTRTQIEGAIANGGVFNGIQLPQDTLTQVYAGIVGRDKIQADTIAQTMPAATALKVATDTLNQTTALATRTQSMFGGKGIPELNGYLQQGADTIRQLVEATKSGAPPEIITALTQKIALNSAAAEKAVDAGLLRQTGGDKRAAGYMKSFVMGTPMTAGSSTEALTYFALKGSLPEGMSASPEAKQIFAKAQQLVEQHRNDKGGNGKQISEANLQTIVNRELQAEAGKIIGSTRFERLWNDMPAIADKIGHPFGKIGKDAWVTAKSHAETEAVTAMAHVLGTDPDKIRNMVATGKPIDTTPDSQTLFANFQKNAGQYNAAEQAALIRELDDLPQIQPGRRNSSLLMDMTVTPGFNKIIGDYTQALGSNSMGDYLVNPVSQGALESNVEQYGQGLRTAQSDVSRSNRVTARQQASTMMFNPNARVGVILRSINGVGKDGAQALSPIVDKALESFMTANIDPKTGIVKGAGMEFPHDRMVREENFVLNFLQSNKFEDPKLEAYRKTAVKGWAPSAQQVFNLVENMHDVFTQSTGM